MDDERKPKKIITGEENAPTLVEPTPTSLLVAGKSMPPKRSARRKKKPAVEPTESDDSASDSDDGAPVVKRRQRKAAARGDKKRAKRAEKDTFWLVDEETDEISDESFKGKCGADPAACAAKLAKKAWAKNKHMIMIELEHAATGTRYQFNSNDWSSRKGGKAKFSKHDSGSVPLHIRVTHSSSSGRSTGLTPTLRGMGM